MERKVLKKFFLKKNDGFRLPFYKSRYKRETARLQLQNFEKSVKTTDNHLKK